MAALITQKPSSVIAGEGENVSLQCTATGQPTPTVTWRKALSHLPKQKTAVVDGNLTILNIAKKDGGLYACSAKNLLGEDSAVAQVTVFHRLKFILTPPLKIAASEFSNLMLNCAAQGATDVVNWKRAGQSLPQNHFLIQMALCFLGRWTEIMLGLTHA